MKHRSRSFSQLGTFLVALALGASMVACHQPTDPSSGAKAITSFQFLGISSVVKINENASPKTINASVPFDTDVSQLVAVFSTTGSSVAYGSVKQVSGVSKNDFSDPLTYTVTAADGTTQDYIVTVTAPGVTSSSAKAITAFSFMGYSPTVKIDQATNSIAVTVASGTDITKLVATFTTTGASVKVGSTEQTSGVTANDFTDTVTYRVTAVNGKTRDYMVTVTKPGELSSAKALTAFSFVGYNPSVTIDQEAGSVAVTLPYRPDQADITKLVATFATTGTSVKVGETAQVSGTTVNNFSSPVTYTVTAANGTTKDYVVTVTAVKNSAKAITAFSFIGFNPSVSINETAGTIAVTLPYPADDGDQSGPIDLKQLIATFTTTGSSVAVGATIQESGKTVNDFSAPVIYTVTAADATTRDYTVTVTALKNPAKVITAFSIQSPAATGSIDEAAKTISVTLPYGTSSVTNLVASFTTTGASVKVGETVQVSGTTPNNFSSPLTYTVTAADATSQDYVVTVTVQKNSAKAITAFSFVGYSASAAISSGAITISLPFGTDVTKLVASFTTTGASVKVGAAVQVSGTTPNDFGSPVTYTVTAENGTSQDYVVTVTLDKSSTKAITAFSFVGYSASATIDEPNKTIDISLPRETDVTALKASFTTTGASVKVGTTIQVSGTTVNNFSSPLTYTVTAADNSTAAYMVTVTIPSSYLVSSVTSGAASITGLTAAWYNSTDAAKNDLVIPSTIGGLPVTSIAIAAFAGRQTLTSLSLPSSITTIGASAFIGCNALQSLNLPSGVTSLGDSALRGCSSLGSITIPSGITSLANNVFLGCSSLTSITIPLNVTSIGNSAFFGCSGLTSLVIPSSVKSVGYDAFASCTGLTSFSLPATVTTVDSSGALFEGSTNLKSVTILANIASIGSSFFRGCSSLTSVTLPATVTSIGDWAFLGCTSLANLTIPASVTSLGDGAFENCSSLTAVTLPASLKTIGKEAFENCTILTSIVIPSGVTSIGDYAFCLCSGLTSVTIPSSVTSLGLEIFYNCGKLTDVILSSGLTSLGSLMFDKCTGLKNLTIPASVTSIGNYAFYNCSGLVSLNFLANVTSLADGLFYGCTNLASFTIPAGITRVGSSAFYNCTSLKTMTFPASVTDIGTSALLGSAIEKIYAYPAIPPNFSGYGFETKVSPTIYVPAASYDLYLAASGWNYYSSFVKM